MPDRMGQSGRQRLPPCVRIRRRRDFEHALSHGARLADACLTVWAIPNQLACARLGLVVGRKHGSAVRRNRLKRLLREAFRLTRPRLPAGLDFVCAPRFGTDMTLAECVESLTRLAERLAQRLTTR